MADNTVQNGTDTIASDDVTTLNGAGSSGVKVQRVKVMHGADGTATDVSDASPLPIRNRIDGARTLVAFTYTSTAPVVADTLLTLSSVRGGTTGSGTSFAVTAGKTLKLIAMTVSLRATAATTPWGLATLRINHSGAAALASPAHLFVPVGGTAAVAGNTGFANLPLDVELSGTMQFGVSLANNVNTNVANITVLGYEY